MNEKEFCGIIINPSCSNFCLFCNPNREKISEKELRIQEIKIAKNLTEFKSKGFKKIEISGCDPIEYDKLINLVKYIKDLGFKTIQLSTHGKNLSDRSFTDKLIKCGINKFRIPLYGSKAKIHDSITRTTGSFEETLTGIKNIIDIKNDIELQISSLVMKQNKDDLIPLTKIVHDLNIKDFYFSIPCILNNDYSYYVPLKKLGKYIIPVLNYSIKYNYKIDFMEIPFCVFKTINHNINNRSLPPNLGQNCQPPDKYKSNIKDLPNYRIKEKIEICNNCQCFNYCDGFFINDIKKFGIGDLKPL